MKSAIDIGTNTVLLLVAEAGEDRRLKVIYEDQRVPRLGMGVDRSCNLISESVNRVVRSLNEYKQILSRRYPEAEQPVVTATSAVRDAGNREEFISKVFRKTGYKVQVLSGKEEAEYTFLGALSTLNRVSGPVAVLDIGGGSTEVSIGEVGQLYDRHSFDMGCVRFTERYLKGDPPSEVQIQRCRDRIKNEFRSRTFNLPGAVTLVGVAGTVTSLAFMEAGKSGPYNADDLNGTSLSMSQIQAWIGKIKSRPASWLLEHYTKVMEGRADIFLAGLLILEAFMKQYKMNKLLVSTGGIRYGTLAVG